MVITPWLGRQQLLAIAEHDAIPVERERSALAHQCVEVLRLLRQVSQGDFGKRLRRGTCMRGEGDAGNDEHQQRNAA